MSETKDIFIKIDRCVGCHTCEIACAVEHSTSKQLLTAIGEDFKPRKRLFVEAAAGASVPVLCRHCEEAPCATVCPTGAIYRDEAAGLVLQKSSNCIGCHMCLQACPFGMVALRAGSRVTVKCDRCPDRQRPACVEACPTRALEYVAPESHVKGKRRAVVGALVTSYSR